MSANFKEVLVKGGERREVYWSVTKRQMLADGWVKEDPEAKASAKARDAVADAVESVTSERSVSAT